MQDTPNLKLPYILQAQAQKHVTHNEAIRALDALVQMSVSDAALSVPPSEVADGARYIVASPADGAWTGHEDEIAAMQDGAWAFYTPAGGWLAWNSSNETLLVFSNGNWQTATSGSGSPNSVDRLGIGATADDVNRLAVRSAASLFDNAGQDHQMKINRASDGDTASLLMQTAYTGEAEMGLSGPGGFALKVSMDGTAWHDALRVDHGSGRVVFSHSSDGAAINISPVAGDPSQPQDGDIWYNATAGQFRKREAGTVSAFSTGTGSGGGGLPQGPEGAVQINIGGTFYGSSKLVWNGNTNRLGLGTNPDEQLHLTGNIRLPTSAPGVGEIRTGAGRYIHASGLSSFYAGQGSGPATHTGAYNVALGPLAGAAMTSGSRNVAVGPNALSSNTSGFQNIAIGNNALKASTNGSRNFAIGTSTLAALSSGAQNLALGNGALENVVTGTDNVAMGNYTLRNLTAGDRNVVIGASAAYQLTQGEENIFIGINAGLNITSGSGNVLIGKVLSLPTGTDDTIVLADGRGHERLTIDRNGNAAFRGPPVLPPHTITSLPDTARTPAGAMIWVSNATGGGVPAYCDGTDWRRSTDATIID